MLNSRYGIRIMGTWPHVSLGVSAHLWPLKYSHISFHLPIGIIVVGFTGRDK